MTDRTCYVDIEDSAGNKLGGGPITSITAWSNTLRLDKPGAFSFTMPANDPKAAIIDNLLVASIYALAGGAWQYVGGGVIDYITRAIEEDGTILLTARGDDLLRELTFPTQGVLAVGSALYPATHAEAVATLGYYVPPALGWVFVPDPAPSHNEFYGQFNWESPLAAAGMLAKRADSHFRMTAKRTLSFGNTWAASGLRAIRANGDLAPETCAIVSLQVTETSQDVVTDVIAFGGGSGKSALNLYQATNAPPYGFQKVYDGTQAGMAYINNTTLSGQLGYHITRVLEFKDIAPLSTTALDMEVASNELMAAAAAWLRRHSRIASAYEITLEGCEQLLLPLSTLRVVYRDPLMGLTLDEDLYVLEVTWEGGPDAPRVTRVIVGDSDWWPESDAEIVATNIRQGMVYQVHPQMSANSYVIAYAKSLDDVTEAQFRFRFDDEVWQIARATFDFQLLPLESTVKAVGLEQSTGGTITTSFTGDSGTPSAANSGAPSVSNSGAPSTDVSGAVTGDTGAVTGNTSAPSSDATGAVTGNTGGATGDTGSTGGATGDPTGGDIISGGQHQHYLAIASSTYGLNVLTDGSTFRSSGSAHNVLTSLSGAHVHGVTAHTHTLNSHAHTLGNHTHTLGNHTHTLGSHTHTLGNHTHSLGNHTHTLSAHTHSLAHTHTITHDHVFTPSVYMQYGLFRDTAGNTFALADLEYTLDGTTWYGFSPGVNGYAFMGDGWNRIDITDLVSDTSVGGSFTPLAANWLLRIRRKTTGALKKATIDAQLTIRCMIRGYSFS